MFIHKVIYTGLVRSIRGEVAKNARRRKIDFTEYEPTNAVSKMKPKKGRAQVYSLVDAKSKLRFPQKSLGNVMIVYGNVQFDFPLTQIDIPPEDWQVAYLEGSIHSYVISEEERAVAFEDVTIDIPESELERDDDGNIREDQARTRTEPQQVPDRRHRPMGPWFKAKMSGCSAFILKDSVVDEVLKAAKPFFESHPDADICDLFADMQLVGYVLNTPCCGILGHVETPNNLRTIPVLDSTTEDGNVQMELALPKIANEDLPRVSVVTVGHDDHDPFFLTMMSFMTQDYPADKIEWIIVDDTVQGRSLQKCIPLEEKRAKYFHCNVKDGTRLSLGKKLNVGCQQATHDIVVLFLNGMYYPPGSLRARVAALLSDETIEMVGSTELGIYNTRTAQSFTLKLADVNDHATVYHQESVAFKKEFWWRRPFNEGLIDDNRQNIACIPFSMQRYSMLRDMSYEFVGVKIDTKQMNLLSEDELCGFSYSDWWNSDFKAALIDLSKQRVEYSRIADLSF